MLVSKITRKRSRVTWHCHCWLRVKIISTLRGLHVTDWIMISLCNTQSPSFLSFNLLFQSLLKKYKFTECMLTIITAPKPGRYHEGWSRPEESLMRHFPSSQVQVILIYEKRSTGNYNVTWGSKYPRASNIERLCGADYNNFSWKRRLHIIFENKGKQRISRSIVKPPWSLYCTSST